MASPRGIILLLSLLLLSGNGLNAVPVAEIRKRDGLTSGLFDFPPYYQPVSSFQVNENPVSSSSFTGEALDHEDVAMGHFVSTVNMAPSDIECTDV